MRERAGLRGMPWAARRHSNRQPSATWPDSIPRMTRITASTSAATWVIACESVVALATQRRVPGGPPRRGYMWPQALISPLFVRLPRGHMRAIAVVLAAVVLSSVFSVASLAGQRAQVSSVPKIAAGLDIGPLDVSEAVVGSLAGNPGSRT